MIGTDYIKWRLRDISSSAGVYQYYGIDGNLLYIGKAKNLRKRISQYQNIGNLSRRIGSMVSQICKIEYIETQNEELALILEAQLIKKHQPKYNILMRDDKSYPYIEITKHKFPKLQKYRGDEVRGRKLFGPFSSADSVNISISYLQKIFKLRSCSDMELKSATRPCMEYEIGRCAAPCMGYISQDNYNIIVKDMRKFLAGRNKTLLKNLKKELAQYVDAENYEEAKFIKSRLAALEGVQPLK